MNNVLLLVGLVFLAACATLILISALLQWMQWLVATIISLLASGLRLLWHGMGKASRALARAMQAGTAWTAKQVWRGIKAGLRSLLTGTRPDRPAPPEGRQRQEPRWVESPAPVEQKRRGNERTRN